tara:strand:+ start:46 stop:285 length:240 start_codon:yes stop_codon:yes gene_type:complete
VRWIGQHIVDLISRFRNDVYIEGALIFKEKSADPVNPAEGHAVIWMSDGTGTGDDGDVLIKITAGGATKTTTLADFSSL